MKRLLLALALLLLPAQAFASSCNVTEFSLYAPGGVQVAQMPPLVDQTPITTSGTSAQSSAFSGDTKISPIAVDRELCCAASSGKSPENANCELHNGMHELCPFITTRYVAVRKTRNTKRLAPGMPLQAG